MECSARTCPFKIKLSGYHQIVLVERIVTSATHQDLLFNHNQAFTQLTIEHSQLQARYEELWKCYGLLVQEKHSTSVDEVQAPLFDPNVHIPQVIPDSEPSSPFRNNPPFLGFTQRPPSKPLADLSMPLFDSDENQGDGSTTEDESDDMGSDWEIFKAEYERRRREKSSAGKDTTRNSKLDSKLAVFINKMDRKYPYDRPNSSDCK